MAYSVGESVTGTVSSVTAYGAFVRLGDGSTGMIHISKLSYGFVSDIHSVIKVGDEVTATVISSENGRIALSLVADREKTLRNGGRSKPQNGPADFESMLSSFKSISDEKLSALNRFHNNGSRKRRK